MTMLGVPRNLTAPRPLGLPATLIPHPTVEGAYLSVPARR